MKRGELWTAAGGSAYANKPLPVLIVQDDLYAATESIAICGLTTDPTATPFTRPLLRPDGENGLREPSRVMVDKITTVPKLRLRDRLGRVSHNDMRGIDQAMMLFLGLAR